MQPLRYIRAGWELHGSCEEEEWEQQGMAGERWISGASAVCWQLRTHQSVTDITLFIACPYTWFFACSCTGFSACDAIGVVLVDAPG